MYIEVDRFNRYIVSQLETPNMGNDQELSIKSESVQEFAKRHFVHKLHLSKRITAFMKIAAKRSSKFIEYRAGFCPIHLLDRKQYYPFHIQQITRICSMPSLFDASLFLIQNSNATAYWFDQSSESSDNNGIASHNEYLVKDAMGDFYYGGGDDARVPPFYGMFDCLIPTEKQELVFGSKVVVSPIYPHAEMLIASIIQRLMDDFADAFFDDEPLRGHLSAPDANEESKKKLCWDFFEFCCVQGSVLDDGHDIDVHEEMLIQDYD